MKRLFTFSVLLLALALAVACTPAANIDSGEGSAVAGTFDALVESLAAAGLSAQEGDMFSGEEGDPLFDDSTPRSLTAGDATIQVYEFATEAEAEAAAATVNPTGNIIGNKTVDWIEPPHFYRQSRFIVLYPGDDEAILSALAIALGEPFVAGAGGFIQP